MSTRVQDPAERLKALGCKAAITGLSSTFFVRLCHDKLSVRLSVTLVDCDVIRRSKALEYFKNNFRDD